MHNVLVYKVIHPMVSRCILPYNKVMTYQTLKSQAFAEIEIKKSIFKSYAYPIESRTQLNQYVLALREKYPDARHHCFGYIIGNPSNTTSAGFDDDGEPSGTAGKPILNVLQHKKIGNCGIIVVRYFGGIKLGAGGLTRAYSQSAQAVVDVMELMDFIPKSVITLKTDFATEAQCRHLAKTANATILSVDYASDVAITLEIANEAISQISDHIGGLNIKLVDENHES